MATQLFITPQVFDSRGRLVPKYLSTDLSGASFVCMPYGLEMTLLVATDPNPSLAAEADVWAFPVDLDSVLDAPAVSALQAFLQNLNIPNKFIRAGQTYRSVVKVIAQCFQILQRHNGLFGAAIFSSNTSASLAAQSAAIVNNTAIPAASVQIGIARTLSGPLPTAVHTNLTAVAGSFSFTAPDPNSTVEDALTFLGGQFQARLVMDRGDGFSL